MKKNNIFLSLIVFYLLLSLAKPSQTQAATPTTPFGDGADGSISVSTSKNINTVVIKTGGTYADGIAYRVIAPSDSSTSVTRYSGSDTISNGIAAGDDVIIINLQGASGDYADVGNYEIMEVQSVSASTITFTSAITRSYDGTTASNQKVVIQRVPNYTTVTVSSGGTITASAWEGLATTPTSTAGYLTGIVAFKANGSITVNSGGTISVNSLGYRGGAANSIQGESLAGTGVNNPAANLGGGGAGPQLTDGHAGGGGGYGTAGSNGGPGQDGNPGLGGGTYGDAALADLHLGSGGGGGGPGAGTGGAGGRGGGIIYISQHTFSMAGTMTARGANGGAASGGTSSNGASGGGGGSAGSISITGASLTLGSNLITALGGTGGAGSLGYDGGPGGVGRIAVYYANTPSGTTNPTASSSLISHTGLYATGGYYTESGGYGIHTFFGNGTFTQGSSMNVEALVVAGGGGGGQDYGGGGGGGGVIYNPSFAVTAQAYSITVGAGGPGSTNGYNSVFSTLTAVGGGKGGKYGDGSAGGSGGGAGYTNPGTGGAPTAGQGYAGGTTSVQVAYLGSGGGGGGVAGFASNHATYPGWGGNGYQSSISGTSTYYAGGGGSKGGNGKTSGSGGLGGGGAGGVAGTPNTGGGGGSCAGSTCTPFAGGSGIVIIRYALIPPAPTAPTIGTPEALSQTSIRWVFTDNASNETGFKVYDTSDVLKATCASTNLTYCDETGLTANTSYTRKVVAYNAGGNSSYSSTATISTLPNVPTAPTIGTPIALSNTSIRWVFTDNADNETGFKVYDTDNVLKVTCASANLTYCDETGLTANTSYTRKVVAYNAGGNSSYSGTATISTLATSCQPSITQTTHTISASCSFGATNTVNDYVRGGDRVLTGLLAGTGTDNTSTLSLINTNTRLTITALQTLVVGSITIGEGTEIWINEGGEIELDKPVWVVDADNDGFGAAGGYLQLNAPTNGKRLNLLTSLTLDCNDSSYNVANTCTNCAPEDTPATIGSDLYGTTCKKCVGGYAVNQTSSEDLFTQCATAAAGQANSCMGPNCNGAGACAYIAAGEASQAVCKRCSGSSYDPINVADNTQDAEGSNLCNQTCKNCDGSGSCIIQSSSEDLFNQCTADNCDTGNCNGTTAACHNGGTWTQSCQTCCTQNQICAGGNGCGNCASGPFSGCTNYYVPYPTPPAAEICRCTYCQINYSCNCTWSCQ